LIFILSQQEGARRELASLVYKGNMLDRATPVRNMIGALALAKQLDYRSRKSKNEMRAPVCNKLESLQGASIGT
jgi:hypothetical protein